MSFLNLLKNFIPHFLIRLLQPLYHYILAFLAALFYFFPSRKLIVVGVTGTNGKSTVVELVHAIFTEAGFKTGSISSLRFKLGQEEKQNKLKMTMPGRFTLQKFLRECIRAKCKYAVLEVTSEGIKQYRNRFIKFDIAVMTNVTPEHIESHGSFERYLAAKLKLFKQVSQRSRSDLDGKRSDLNGGVLIANSDDPSAKKFLQFPANVKYAYNSSFIGTEKGHIVYKMPITEKLMSPEGISFKIDGVTISSKLIGEFNLYNILTAISVALSQNIKLENIKSALVKVSGIPGRLEFIPVFVKTSAGKQKESFKVVVDYAHTPDALFKVYQTLKSVNPKSEIRNPKLICVLGSAGGGRDKWKRPELGRIAAEFCDKIILTNEDPYDENPLEIIKDIEKGFSSISNFQFPISKILDRREAIREAIKSAKTGDTIIITGKGAEPYIMGPNNTKISWDDRKIVKEELTILEKNKITRG